MKKLLSLFALSLLAACVDAPNRFEPAPLSFASNGAIHVNVAEVRVVSNYKAPLSRPNVEHEFPTPPEAAVKQWIKDRVHAVGDQGVIEFAIDDASVKEVKLPVTKGIKGAFKSEQEARYDATLKVTARLYDGVNAMSAASADVAVNRSKSIREKATIEDREKLYDQMTRDMMKDFDAAMSQRMRQYFANHLR